MKLYIYDHCPFCVRARMIFGLRALPLETEILLNDDEETPVSMIGAKQVPILQKADGLFMGESLDIVRYVDELAGKGRLQEEIRPELQAWLDKVGEYGNKLVQPRMVKIGLPEFATREAVKYFVDKKEKNIGNFAANLDKTAKYLARIHADLQELEPLVGDENLGVGGEVSMEDILLFPVLRNLTIVRGIEWPQKVMDYLMWMSEASGVDMYFDRAL
ncbi:GrxB family glutaredoxin [Neisseria animalis]|uniref:Glutaredoxin, GrxB family n=1 Tax=Neisseria animalis TaxID=492 RepID=A0A5P3MS53_NEIAN|nr:GrxB family glutaredoxin [Neisseria animalis]QEY23469.1 glutaredoxin, GrxB family [Neisseria animalis]ROW33315.1 glutaredoxin, GrxB family [Neisseria animalis]VEE09007.1 glutaredoxin [Neisseria animalis]